MSDYLAYLPTVYDSSMAIEGTKKSNELFDKADLAGIVLKSVITATWVNQYNRTHSTLLKLTCVHLPDLKAVRQVTNEKHQANLKIKAKCQG